MSKILWVDTNDMGGDMVPRRLKRKGFDVVRAFYREQVVEMVHSEKPDLILMDMHLSFKDGEMAIFKLKASETTRHIPVIALTAHAMTSDKEKASKAGFDDVDTKPIEMPRLLSKINRLLSIESSTGD
ncbi:MAG: response regulator [Candidatus Parabeggiatoa sp. nov. 3]|nr:MAG: response regulator [Gammaproteobacteria bacterium]RKZ81871.1 MAG: response regulator [Gammaproteobacteria bacterium]